MWEYVFFDLDGTLIDSEEGITRSVQHMLRHFDIDVEDRSSLRRFIGPPIQVALKKYYGFDDAKIAEATVVYRAYFAENGIHQNEVYEGVHEMLAKLHGEGMRLALATSKPEPFAKQIMNELELEQYFTFMAGSLLDGGRDRKSEVIDHVLQECCVEDKCLAIMVGDRHYDVNGANESGLASIGVLWGFGDEKELRQAGAAYVVSRPEELTQLLLKGDDSLRLYA